MHYTIHSAALPPLHTYHVIFMPRAYLETFRMKNIFGGKPVKAT
jgi:hypothetical protein